ncbi:MAG: hypothetical protein ABGW81_08975 [Paracoccaceae bacterium]
MADETKNTPLDKTGKKAKAAKREERLRAALRVNMHKRKSQKRARKDIGKGEQDG